MQNFFNTSIFFYTFFFNLNYLSESKFFQYCRNRYRLINVEELDEYIVIGVEINATVQLSCHFCNEVNNDEPKLWYFQDRDKENQEFEIDIDVNNVSMNKLDWKTSFDLIIRDFDQMSGGIYKCHGPLGEDQEKKYNYRLEPLFERSKRNLHRGNLTEWEIYRNTNIIPVTHRFIVSSMHNISIIRNSGVILEVVSKWSDWSDCGPCIDKKGLQTNNVQCLVMSHFKDSTLNNDESRAVYNFFKSSRILPCRSILLNEKFPLISKAVRDLPDFILERTCHDCKKIKEPKKKKFKYKRRIILKTGGNLILTCPDITVGSLVTWHKEKSVLKIGYGRSFRKGDNTPHILVDIFSSLHLIDVSEEESGNYSCYVSGVNMMEVKIQVLSQGTLLSQALLRHMGYIGFILFIALISYCARIIIACKNPPKYARKTYENVLQEQKERELKKRMPKYSRLDEID